MDKYALLFPGQGSQYTGMGKSLIEKDSSIKIIFEEASEILGFKLIDACQNTSQYNLQKSCNAQVAILTVSYASYLVYKNLFIENPSFVLGHSLGEYSALVVAGSLNFSDALKIVYKRGLLMDEVSQSCLGSMVALNNISLKVLEEICAEISKKNKIIVISNYNGPNEIVLSGHNNAINELELLIQKKTKANMIKLNVSAPFHSPIMEPIVFQMKTELGKYTFNFPKIPIISSVDGKPYNNRNVIENLTNQICSPVYWSKAIDFLIDSGVKTFIDVGPKSILKNLVKSHISINNILNYKTISTFSLDNKEDIKAIEQNRRQLLTQYLKNLLKEAITEKNLNSSIDDYQEKVVNLYHNVEQTYKKVKQGSIINNNDLYDVEVLINKILKYKRCT